MSVAQGNSLGVEPLYLRQREALNSVLPLGNNHVDVFRYLTTGQIAMQMPFASQELNQPGGGYYGQSKQSGNLVICDRGLLASPMGFVCGKPGSGKSFSVKREITNTILAHPGDEVIIFDPAGEYGNLISALGGSEHPPCAGNRHDAQPVRHGRRIGPQRRDQARLQDRRDPGPLVRAHGRGIGSKCAPLQEDPYSRINP